MAAASQVKPQQQPTAKTDFVKLSSEDEKAKARHWRECLPLFLFIARVRFGLAFGRSKAFEAIEELLFGHPVGGDVGIVGVHPGTRCANERNRLRLGLVDFYIFLQ